MRIIMHTNQNGMILVLAMFMMALLSMIGIASMMTSTTDIEIASGEQQYVETFYRSQSSHTIAGELLHSFLWDRGLYGEETADGTGYKTSETINPVGDPAAFADIEDDTFAFRLIDPDVIKEDFDSVSKIVAGRTLKIWQADGQEIDELPCPQDMTASECKALDESIGNVDLDLWTDLRLIRRGKEGEEITLADVDIDKVRADPVAGGGAEFGSKDLGIGSTVANLMYNVDARARLESGDFDKSPSRQALGFRVVK
jgi:hypothetical protein